MSRKWAFLLVLMLISATFTILIPTHGLATEPARVYVDPPSIVDPSGLFNVSVKVDNVQGLVGVQLKLYWDPALLYGVNMTDVIFHEVTPQSEWDNIWRIAHEIDNVAGVANYAYTFTDMHKAVTSGYAPISGNFTIFVLLFQVRGMGNCTLHFAMSKLGDDFGAAIVHDTVDGFFSNSLLPPSIPPVPSEDAQVLFYIEPHGVKNESLVVNSTFSIAIRLDSVLDHPAIVQFSFILEWNATLLQWIGATEVMFHEVMPQNQWRNIDARALFVDNTRGILEYASSFYNLTATDIYGPFVGNYTLAVITFRVLDVGKCQLYLHMCQALVPPNGILLSYAFSGIFANMVSADLNGDGVVDLYDALILARSFGARPQNSNWVEDADINGDGIVDIYDAITLCYRFGHTR